MLNKIMAVAFLILLTIMGAILVTLLLIIFGEPKDNKQNNNTNGTY